MRAIACSLMMLWATSAIWVRGEGIPAVADPLAAWQSDVRVGPVCPPADRHTIHAYFNVCPESPDGRWVLFYASATDDSQQGELRLVERATAQETRLIDGLETEDAHRAACQQWISGGRRVAFHNVRQGRWSVAVVDMDTRRVRTLVYDRQLCWGAVQGDLLPLYGCHWSPGPYRDLELVNAASGQVLTVVTAEAVKAAYPKWIDKAFGDRPISVFFPILSPDGNRVFFKIATPGGGDFRSRNASKRLGLVAYDLQQSRFLFLSESWGHPAWHPDSRGIIEKGNLVIDAADGQARRIPGLPGFSGSHPSYSPDGKLFVTDCALDKTSAIGGRPGEWGIVVCRTDGAGYALIHRFDNSRGARSWRVSHPHPVFSADGKRIYFNASDTAWTRLLVAEIR